MYIALRILFFLSFLLGLFFISNGFRMNARIKSFAVILIVFLSIGQGIINDRIFYPFVYWGMYISPNPAPNYIQYTIRDVNGVERDYPFEILSFSSPRAFEAKLYNLIKDCSCENKDPLINKYVSSMNDIYKKEIYKDGFAEMEIKRVIFDIDNGGVQKELIYKWNANSDVSN